MTVSSAHQAVFANTVVGYVWQELQLAGHEQQFIGIAFDDPYSIRDAIWVSYAPSAGTFLGQDQRYEASLWPDFCLLFELLDRLVTWAQYPRMVHQSCEPRWQNHDRVCLSVTFSGREAHPDGLVFLERCLRRVDQVMTQLHLPLDD